MADNQTRANQTNSPTLPRNRPADNLNSGIKGTATIYAAIASGGTTKFKTQTRDYLVPMRNQYFTYDADGNLLTDGLWNYDYDAENRLISMEHRHGGNNSGGFGVAVTTGMLANGEARRLEFTYDYLGRRVQKIVKSFNGTDYDTVIGNRKFLYDDWNLIAEFDAIGTLTLVRSYTWGLDLAGTLDQTGGVGALLQMHDHTATKTYLPTYDGNGNVVSLIDSENTTLTIAALYEYGPYGEAVRTEVSDSTVADFPFRFSTKFTDPETGLVYYGHRYYSATLGRFITRDPIGEQGGLNLFGFVGNDPINRADYLGLDDEIVKLPTYEVTTTPWTKLNDILFGLYSGGGNSNSFGSFDFDSYITAIASIPRSATAVTKNTPALKKTPTDWKPNRSDCDALRTQYPHFFTKENTPLKGMLDATIAGTIAVGAQTADMQHEYYTTIYRTSDGLFAYTAPQRVEGRPVGGRITFNNPSGTTMVAAAHGHNVGFFTYWAYNSGATEQIYRGMSQLFSPADQKVSMRPGLPTVLIYTQSDTLRAFSSKKYTPSETANHPGHEVPGSPTPETLNKIRQCVSAGF